MNDKVTWNTENNDKLRLKPIRELDSAARRTSCSNPRLPDEFAWSAARHSPDQPILQELSGNQSRMPFRLPTALHQNDRGQSPDPEPSRQIRALVDVDFDDPGVVGDRFAFEFMQRGAQSSTGPAPVGIEIDDHVPAMLAEDRIQVFVRPQDGQPGSSAR